MEITGHDLVQNDSMNENESIHNLETALILSALNFIDLILKGCASVLLYLFPIKFKIDVKMGTK